MLPPSYFREIPGEMPSYVPLHMSRQTAREALSYLPAEFYIAFYDATENRGGSDPGTYFSMRRRGPVWQITGGNHGWSHGIAEVDQEAAERFFHYCLPSNCGPYPDCISLVPDSLESHWQAAWSGRTLQKRIAKILSKERADPAGTDNDGATPRRV